MAKLKIKLGKSAGQKAVSKRRDKEYSESFNEYDVEMDPYGASPSRKTGKYTPEERKIADKANKKALDKISKGAKAGRKKAEKALGKKIPKAGFTYSALLK